MQCLLLLLLQFHHSDCLSAWLLHFIATNYLIFSQKPEFQDLSGTLPVSLLEKTNRRHLDVLGCCIGFLVEMIVLTK